MERSSQMLVYGVRLSRLVLEGISHEDYDSARDHTLQLISILNLCTLMIKPTTKNHHSTTTLRTPNDESEDGILIHQSLKKYLEICLEAGENILLQLKNHLQTHSSVIPSLGSVSTVVSTQSKLGNSGEKLREISFQNIIGSDDAKQVLYENVILPLSLTASMRSQIFQGIRATVGNVLLFGPPGTGHSLFK